MFKFILIYFFFLSISHAQSYRFILILNGDGQLITDCEYAVETTQIAGTSDSNGRVYLLKSIRNSLIIRFDHVAYQSQEFRIKDVPDTLILLARDYYSNLIQVSAVRTDAEFVKPVSILKHGDIQKNNRGQDLPSILNDLPSLVTHSDAGNGIGYSSMWIRGTDISRINVTINGFPLNDAESQAVYWVDVPDMSSSAKSIEVQRGIASSTNGPGSFGANISIETGLFEEDFNLEFNNSFGSFNSRKSTFFICSGNVLNHFNSEFRVSQIESDGFMDRAFTKMLSFHGAMKYMDYTNDLRLIVMNGKEKTYQSWYGVPEEELKKNHRTFNIYEYENQTDNYWQNHYQILWNKSWNRYWLSALSFNYTQGYGYYEEFQNDELFADYGLINSIGNGDLIRRKYLDNHFVAGNLAIDYLWDSDTKITASVYHSQYNGDHEGRVIKIIDSVHTQRIDYPYYFNSAVKYDDSFFLKYRSNFTDFSSLIDIQFRRFSYRFESEIDQQYHHVKDVFINPKFSFAYQINESHNIGLFFAWTEKEGNRSDYRSAQHVHQVKPEKMFNLELSHRYQSEKFITTHHLYLMYYRNQLALSGQLNDVGSAIRINLDKSYRVGLESEFNWKINTFLSVNNQIQISENKIIRYNQYVDEYGNNFDEWLGQRQIAIQNSTISFSPTIVQKLKLNYNLKDYLTLVYDFKYISEQYLDNMENDQSKLNAYSQHDLNIYYNFSINKMDVNLIFTVQNIFSHEFESNGWTYPYYLKGHLENDNAYYPQAGRTYWFSLNLSYK